MHPALMAQLARHEQKREGRLPVVTVLAGPIELAKDAVARWAAQRGRAVVEQDEHRLDRLIEVWVGRLAIERDLASDAVAWLARRLGKPEAPLVAAVARQTRFERHTFLNTSLSPGDASLTERACRWLIERGFDGEPTSAQELISSLSAEPPERVTSALLDLIPIGSGPVLLVTVPHRVSDAGWPELAMQSLSRLAIAEPRLTCALVIKPDLFEAYLQHALESRAKALAQAGLIRLSTEAVVQSVGPAPKPIGPIRPAPEDDDAARSAAERFLFDCVASLPETAGLFELNGLLDVPFGSFPQMEVDLLARGPGIAIEIDGYYHFQDMEAYRRDRRKDLALQTEGYLVVRVLAEDVVLQLETILGTIQDAVAKRHHRAIP